MPDAAPRSRQVRLFRNNRSQAIRIPVEFELPGTDAIISRDGDRLIVEPLHKGKLRDLLAGWEPIDDAFPDVDAGLPPLRDIKL